MSFRRVLLLVVLVFAEVAWSEGLSSLCHDRGVQLPPPKGPCACNNGFYGKYCESPIGVIRNKEWTAVRVILCLAYGTILIGTTALLIFSVRSERRDSSAEELASSGLFKVKTIILVLIILICIFTLLNWAVDPNGGEYVYPFLIYRYIFGAVFPLFSTLFGTVLFHWKNIYDISVAAIKRELMLEKINSNYESQVSLDTILRQSNVFRRTGYLYLFWNLAAWAFQFIRETILGLGIVTTLGPLQPIWMIFFCLLFFTEAIGIIVYGIKLKSIMPKAVLTRLAPVTHKVMGIAVTYALMWVIAIGLLLSSASAKQSEYIAVEAVVRFAFAVDLLAILTLFFRFSSKFPFIYRGNTTAETTSENEITSEIATQSDLSQNGITV